MLGDMRRKRGRVWYRALGGACWLSLLTLPLSAEPSPPVAGVGTATVSSNAGANATRRLPPAATVQSVFHIEKSENRNQVHYAVRVDAGCHPQGARPVFGYWRDFEVGPRATSVLLDREQVAYGLTPPRYVRSTPEGGQIRVSLRGFPARPLTIDTFRQGTLCAARAVTTIANEAAVLDSIYVKIGFLFSVDYAILRGLRLVDGSAVQEKMRD
jgi:hypothetical protein